MKKLVNILLIVFLSLGTDLAYGQEHATVQLEKGTKLLKSASSENGIVLLTGGENALSKSPNWKISYYTPHLTTKYQTPISDAGLKSNSNTFLVVSPTGHSVYFIKHGGGSNDNQTIMQIDSAGFSSTFTIKDELAYDRVNVVFADDNFLYYVTKEKDPAALNKHAFPKLQFVRVAKDKSVSKIMLALPEPDPDATQWSYIGHTDVVSYFASRTLNDESYKEEKYRIAVIDHNGRLQDDFKIDLNIENGKLMPGFNYCGTLGAYEVDNHNIKNKLGKDVDNAGKSTPSTWSPYPEAYGNIMLDPFTNGFYIYGITGTNATGQKSDAQASKEDNLEPTGIYVYKFDQDGKQVWNYEGKLTGIDDYFKSKAGFAARQIALQYGAQGNIRFQAFAAKNIATVEINPQTGKLVSSYANTFAHDVNIDDLGLCFKSGEKSDLNKFLSQPAKGDYTQLNFRTLTNNMVVRNYFHDSRLELYAFGDE